MKNWPKWIHYLSPERVVFAETCSGASGSSSRSSGGSGAGSRSSDKNNRPKNKSSGGGICLWQPRNMSSLSLYLAVAASGRDYRASVAAAAAATELWISTGEAFSGAG